MISMKKQLEGKKDIWGKYAFVCDKSETDQYRRFCKTNDVEIREAFAALKDKKLYPAGDFDNAGRFYAAPKLQPFFSCRSPSARYPYSEMQACRTLKLVRRIAYINQLKTSGDILVVIC